MNFFSYPTVSPFDHHLLGQDWSAFRHVLVVRSGDGDFAKSLSGALPAEARLVLADGRPDLTRAEGTEPLCAEWAFDSLESEVAAHGPFDAILFLHLHEYWGGRVGSLTRYLDLLDPKGIAWIEFLNGTCLSQIERRIVRTGMRGDSLTNPANHLGGLDFQGLIGWANAAGCVCHSLWGLLPPDLFEWVTKKKSAETKIEFLKRKIPVSNPHDALRVGAPVGALCLRRRRDSDPAQFKPGLAVAKLTPVGLQQHLLPAAEVAEREADEFQARTQIRALRKTPSPSVAPHRTEFLSGFTGDASVKKVLLVGGAPAGDWIVLPRAYDDWEWTSLDHDASVARLWKDAFPDAPERLDHWDPESPFPYPDASFDLVLSMGLFSRIQPNLALKYLGEMLRVCGGRIAHLEDTLGPARDLFARENPLPLFYGKLGVTVKAHPMLRGGKPSGLAAVFLARGGEGGDETAFADEAPSADGPGEDSSGNNGSQGS